jgi:hypothetical protein
MGMVTSELSMSLDGFITDPKASVGSPLGGHDPGRLHDWRFDAKTDTDVAIVDEIYAVTGAVILGKRDVRRRLRAVGRPIRLSGCRYSS